MDANQDADARYTIAATSLMTLFAYARTTGVNVDEVMTQLGLDTATLSDPEARLSQAVNHRAWELVTQRVNDADFGLHLGEAITLDGFHVLGHLAARSPTLGQAFARICAYSRILHDAGRVEVELSDGEARIFPGCRGLLHAWPRHIAEQAAASTVTLARLVTGHPLLPTRLGFKHSAPVSLLEHERIFGVRPSFDEEETFVAFEASALQLPIRQSADGLSTFLDAYARELLDKLPKTTPTFAMRVREVIVYELRSGMPELADVAKRLAMTARTLQRRLAEADTSFQDVLDDARRQLAERYVLDGTMAIAEVAFLLGFADPSNFHRAFKRWTGMTPAAFRERGAR